MCVCFLIVIIIHVLHRSILSKCPWALNPSWLKRGRWVLTMVGGNLQVTRQSIDSRRRTVPALYVQLALMRAATVRQPPLLLRCSSTDISQSPLSLHHSFDGCSLIMHENSPRSVTPWSHPLSMVTFSGKPAYVVSSVLLMQCRKEKP